jgi:excinuclease ABC subunit C
VRLFDRQLGPDFLAGVPSEPGVYRLYGADGALLYVGKARDLRRRIGQYRTVGRRKKERKRRTLVTATARITWEVCESELDAALAEVRLIQTLRPPKNVAGAFPFLYPFVGVAAAAGETRFCLTTAPQDFPAFDLHGAFRSRHVTREAFFALMRLLRFLGHPVTLGRRGRRALPRYSHVYGFRRLPPEWPDRCRALLRGASRGALEQLCLGLVEHAGARARSAEVAEDLRAVARFYDDEASPLAAVIEATGFPTYPVPQRDRDLLFLEYRAAARG